MTVMKFSPRTLAFWLGIQIVATGLASAQLLTHGPIVGGVTASEAKVFVRTDSAASVTLRYGSDPDLQTYFASTSVTTNESSDFTATIPLTGLAPETMEYLNVLVNGVPQLSAPPFHPLPPFPPPGPRATSILSFSLTSEQSANLPPRSQPSRARLPRCPPLPSLVAISTTVTRKRWPIKGRCSKVCTIRRQGL